MSRRPQGTRANHTPQEYSMADIRTAQNRRIAHGSQPSTGGASPDPWIEVLPSPATPGVAVIALHGDIDLQISQTLEEILHTALQRRVHLVVDTNDSRLIDCGCLGLLVRARLAAEQHNTILALAGPPALVRLSLEATGLATAFPTFDSRKQALAALAGVRRAPGSSSCTGHRTDRRTAPLQVSSRNGC
jgi:anti-anti-sigma factor